MFTQAEKSSPGQNRPTAVQPKNSNREWKRLESLATPTKQETGPHSNREKQAYFQIGPTKNSNRDTKLLETSVNPTKQTREVHSNRYTNPLFM